MPCLLQPYPESSGVKGLEALRAALTSGSVQEHELLPLAQWWQGGPGPCSALGAAHGAAAEHQRLYNEQHVQALGDIDAQQDPGGSSGVFAALLLLAEAAVEPQPAKETAQEQSVSAPDTSVRQEGRNQNQPLSAHGAAQDAVDGGHEGSADDVATEQPQVEPPSESASPKLD